MEVIMKSTFTVLVLIILAFSFNSLKSHVYDYEFSQSIETFTPITGGTVHGTDLNNDESFTSIPIGFTFNYDGTNFTTLCINSNGYISLGNYIVSSNYILRENICWIIAALNANLIAIPELGQLMTLTEGEAPNRVCTIQWLNYQSFFWEGSEGIFNFQIKLYETSNKIEIKYGSFNTSRDNFFQVGLLGCNETWSRRSRSVPDTGNWANSEEGTEVSNCYIGTGIIPPEGLTYRYERTNMEIISSTTVQYTKNTGPGFTNQQIIEVRVLVSGTLNPLNISSFTFNTNGTSSASDIVSARLFYSNYLFGSYYSDLFTPKNFNTNYTFGNIVQNPDGTFTILGSRTLKKGMNCFWLVYNISQDATIGNYVDAECEYFVCNNNEIYPDTISPAGARQISGPLNGNYTVGAGGDFANLTETFSCIDFLGLAGNTTLTVTSDITEPGTVYIKDWRNFGNGNWTIDIKTNGYWTIESDLAVDGVICIDGADSITIDGILEYGDIGLTIQNNNLEGQRTIFIRSKTDGANYNTIKNCNIVGATNEFSYNHKGIETGGSNNNYLTLDGNTFKKCWIAISLMNAENNIIKNNIIGSDIQTENINAKGIYLSYMIKSEISNNRIFGLDASTFAVTSTGIDVRASEDLLINGNYIHNISQFLQNKGGACGIYVKGTNILISNNVIYDLNSPNPYYNQIADKYWRNPFGIYIENGSKIKLYNNSINIFGEDTYTGYNGTFSAALFIKNQIDSLVVANNVFSNSFVGKPGSRSYAVFSNSTFNKIDYNDYFQSGEYGIIANIKGIDVYTLQELQAVTHQDSNSLAENPLFIDNSNLAPQLSSPLIVAGLKNNTVQEDILGNVRKNYPTIGAYEMLFNDAIAPPNLLSPGNNELCVSQTPNFIWGAVTDATSYYLDIADNSDFTSIIYSFYGITDTTFTMSNLLIPSTQFYWRVMAYSDYYQSIWSQTKTFITIGELETPILAFPGNNSTNVNCSFNLEWLSVVGAVNYQIQVSKNPEFSIITHNISDINQTNQDVINLNINTEYFWRVKASNSVFSSEWSDVWSFTTGSQISIGNDQTYNSFSSYPAPLGRENEAVRTQFVIRAEELKSLSIASGNISSLFLNVHSPNYANTIRDLSLKIKLTNDSVAGKKANENWDNSNFTYVCLLDTFNAVPGWNEFIFNQDFYWDGVSNLKIEFCFNNYGEDVSGYKYENVSTYYSSTNFNSVCYYTYTYNANFCNFNLTYKQLSNFRPNVLLKFSNYSISLKKVKLISPENNSTDISFNPSFNWNSVNYATSYNLQVSTASNFSNLIINEVTSDTAFTPSIALNSNTQYFWRVQALKPNISPSDWSQIWNFVTEPIYITQFINLNQGWNLISSYILPLNTDVVEIFEPIVNSIKLVRSRYNKIYYPSVNFNNIPGWNITDGYVVYATAPAVLQIDGTEIYPENIPINLNQGWNLISYLRATPMLVSLAFNSLGNSLLLVKNNEGKIFNPFYNLNQIEFLLPGEAYWLYMSAPDILIYPEND